MYRRIVFASVQAASFVDASEVLAELGELKLLSKRVWRAAIRIGEEHLQTGRLLDLFERRKLLAVIERECAAPAFG